MESGWAEAANCNWLHEAIFLKSVLDAAGIEARIPDEHTLAANPALGAALGGVRLLVRTDDLEKARRVLESAASSRSGVTRDDRSSHDQS